MRRVGAWAQNVPSDKLLQALLRPWDGRLGVVLGEHQRAWAQAERAFVILNRAGKDVQLPSDTLAVLGSRDEPNVTGPSGPRIRAADVMTDTQATRAWHPSVPVTNGALAFVGTWWESITCRRHFDRTYWSRIRGMHGPWAFNASSTRLQLVKNALRMSAGPWLVCGIPERPAWAPQFTVLSWLIERLVGPSMSDWVRLADKPDVLAVTFWVLLQDGSQTDYGIFRPAGSGRYVLTSVGRALWRAVMGDVRYPVVTPSG